METKENIMGTMPVPRLILKMSLPLMLSLLVNSLYNFVDSVFVAHIGEKALTGLSVAFPVQVLMGALGCGTAVGLNSAVSKALGEKDRKSAGEIASAAIAMAVCSFLLIAVSCVLFIDPYLKWQTDGDAEIYGCAREYLGVCMMFSFGTMFQWVFDRFLIATGKSMFFLATLGCASGVNLILDPILIFGYLGFPAMGTTGAAAATVIGQSCGALLGIILNIRCNKEIPVKFTPRVKLRHIRAILKVGIPTFIMQSIVSFMGIFMNSILLGFSSTAVAVYGVCVKLQSLATIGVHGMNNALIPIAAYNYGAKNKQRINDAVKWTLIYSVLFMLPVFITLEAFPQYVLTLFNASENMLAIGSAAIRIFAVSYFLSMFGMVISTECQALGLANYSMYITLLRQAVFLLPLVMLLPRFGGLNAVWYAFCVSELLVIPIAYILMKKADREINIAPGSAYAV